MAGTGDKLLTAAEIKEVTDTKVDKDFSALTALPNGLSDTDLINVRRSGTNYKLSGSDLAPTPLVASITTGQWSGSGSDYYITVTASNVTANSILVPTYDHTSDSRLKGPVWCVPAAGSFTIHTSTIPTGTVTIMVQFIGTLGEAQYQVLADVYSKSQTDALVAQSTAKLEGLTVYDMVQVDSTETSKPWLVIKRLIESMPTGILIGKIRAGSTYNYFGYKYTNNYATFIVDLYSQSTIIPYKVVKNNGSWLYTSISVGNYTSF